MDKSVDGVMVSIAAFQAVVPGSIPGRRIVYVTISFYLNLYTKTIYWTDQCPMWSSG